MTALGYGAVAVGLVATASLLGTALFTLGVGWIAPRHDLRALLIFGAVLMAATGLAFPNVEHFILIALVAFIGTINPSGGDLGVLVPLEHAMLAQACRRRAAHARLRALQPDRRVVHGGRLARRGRCRIAARPASRSSRRSADVLRSMPRSGFASALLYRRLPHAQMDEVRRPPRRSGRRAESSTNSPRCSAVDAFAGGFVVQSLLALWLFERFDLSLSAAACSFSGRARCAPSPIRSRPGSPSASASSTPWCSRTSRPACS